jgi:hypothetical protein
MSNLGERSEWPLRVTWGEKRGYSILRDGVERGLHALPWVGAPFERAAEQRREVVRQFFYAIEAEWMGLWQAAAPHLRNVAATVPEFGKKYGEICAEEWRRLKDEWQATTNEEKAHWRQLDRYVLGGWYPGESIWCHDELGFKKHQLEELFAERGDAGLVESYRTGDRLSTQGLFLYLVVRTLEKSFLGLRLEQQAIGAPRPETVESGSLSRSIEALAHAHMGESNVLKNALGEKRADRLRKLTALLIGSERMSMSGFISVSWVFAGVALTAPFAHGPEYLAWAGLGLLGGRAVSEACVRAVPPVRVTLPSLEIIESAGSRILKALRTLTWLAVGSLGCGMIFWAVLEIVSHLPKTPLFYTVAFVAFLVLSAVSTLAYKIYDLEGRFEALTDELSRFIPPPPEICECGHVDDLHEGGVLEHGPCQRCECTSLQVLVSW